MITKQEAITISGKTTLTDIEQLQVIQLFIFEKRGIDVGIIDRPTDGVHLRLMSIAFDAACEYFLKDIS